MANLPLVAKQASDWFRGRLRVPEIHCEIIASGDETLNDLVIDRCGFLETFFGFGNFTFSRGRDFAGVVVVGGAEHVFGAERKVIHPMGVSGEIVC